MATSATVGKTPLSNNSFAFSKRCLAALVDPLGRPALETSGRSAFENLRFGAGDGAAACAGLLCRLRLPESNCDLALEISRSVTSEKPALRISAASSLAAHTFCQPCWPL